MNISYITTYNADDIHQWSGLGYYIAAALRQQEANLDMVGDINIQAPGYYEFKRKIYSRLGKRFLPERVPGPVKQAARQAENRIKPSTDLVFSPSTIPLAYIKSTKPKVFYTDATFAGMLDYYPFLTNVCAESIRHGNKIEQAALDSCSLAIYASEWAARSAVENYQVNPGKVKVVPFGANIQNNRTLTDIHDLVKYKDSGTCHLLFLGVEWERKGGDIVFEATRVLHERGVPVMLHIAGLTELPLTHLPSYVRNYGFLSKDDPEGKRQLDELFHKCHFLFVPSRAEAYGLVYCEANSYGIPAIATNTGGITTIIKNDVNGCSFNLHDSAEKYADYIESVFFDKNRYTELAASSFNEYATRLNWKTSGHAIMDLLKAL